MVTMAIVFDHFLFPLLKNYISCRVQFSFPFKEITGKIDVLTRSANHIQFLVEKPLRKSAIRLILQVKKLRTEEKNRHHCKSLVPSLRSESETGAGNQESNNPGPCAYCCKNHIPIYAFMWQVHRKTIETRYDMIYTHSCLYIFKLPGELCP